MAPQWENAFAEAGAKIKTESGDIDESTPDPAKVTTGHRADHKDSWREAFVRAGATVIEAT